MNADQKAALIHKGLGGQHLWNWLPGNDQGEARRTAVASWAGGSWGRTGRDSIHGAAGTVSWTEVVRVVERGCRVPGLRQAYEEAYAVWCRWGEAGGYCPRDRGWTAEQKGEHQALYVRATDSIRAGAFEDEGASATPAMPLVPETSARKSSEPARVGSSGARDQGSLRPYPASRRPRRNRRGGTVVVDRSSGRQLSRSPLSTSAA